MSETIKTKDAIQGAATALEGEWSPAWIEALNQAATEHRFAQDNQGWWYLIPAHEVDNFYAWTQSSEEAGGRWDGEGFDRYAIKTHPSNFVVHNPTPDESGYW